MGLFDSREEQDRQAGEKCGKEERAALNRSGTEAYFTETANDFGAVLNLRGQEFDNARAAAREGRPYEPPQKSSESDSSRNSRSNNRSQERESSSPSSIGNYSGDGGWGRGGSSSSGDNAVGDFFKTIGVIIAIPLVFYGGCRLELYVGKKILHGIARGFEGNTAQHTQVTSTANQYGAERVELPRYKWDTSGMIPYRDDNTSRTKSGLWWWLEERLKDNPGPKGKLEGLAEAIHEETGGFKTDIYEYSQIGENIWAAGEYSGRESSADGFICHSSDNGKSWERQWCSKHDGYPHPVYGIYFSDENEGWALTLHAGILHTDDGGSSWEKIFNEYSCCNLFILDKKNLIVTERNQGNHGIYFYSSEDRGLSWEKKSVTLVQEWKLDRLEKSFGKWVHYGGIYSKEETRQE